MEWFCNNHKYQSTTILSEGRLRIEMGNGDNAMATKIDFGTEIAVRPFILKGISTQLKRSLTLQERFDFFYQ